MKYAALLLCCLMSCDCAHVNVVDVRHTDISSEHMKGKISPLTWDIILDYGNGLVGGCLGTPVNVEAGTMILTAHHCIRNKPGKIYGKKVTGDSKEYIDLMIYKSVEVFDLALLSPVVPLPDGSYTMLATSGPRRLDPYYQLRYMTNKREKLVFFRGHVVREEKTSLPIGHFMLSGEAPKGTSGGPIFNLHGDLICIQTHAGYCTSSLDVYRWFETLSE